VTIIAVGCLVHRLIITENKIMDINEESVVTLKYQLFTVDPGEPNQKVLIEERTGSDPLEFVYGQGIVVKKVEDRLLGQSMGFHDIVKLQPQEAFGPYREDLRVWMDQSKFPRDIEVVMGMKFQTQGPNGSIMSVIVKDIKDGQVLVDGNHPLAGLELIFDVEVLRVRQATEQELEQKKVLKILH
jgi:FKBP-type peptidyl-prolyl cis-trans isomerase SlyD